MTQFWFLGWLSAVGLTLALLHEGAIVIVIVDEP